MNEQIKAAPARSMSPTAQRALAEYPRLPDEALVPVETVSVVLGLGQSTVWRKSARGEMPAPVRLSDRCTRWRVGDIRRFAQELGE